MPYKEELVKLAKQEIELEENENRLFDALAVNRNHLKEVKAQIRQLIILNEPNTK